MAELELEVRGGPAPKWSIFHPLRSRSLVELFEGVEPWCQVILDGRHHDFRSRRTLLQQRLSLLANNKIQRSIWKKKQCYSQIFLRFFFSFPFIRSIISDAYSRPPLASIPDCPLEQVRSVADSLFLSLSLCFFYIRLCASWDEARVAYNVFSCFCFFCSFLFCAVIGDE